MWTTQPEPKQLKADAEAIIKSMESKPDWIAYGRVVRFGTSTSRAGLGPLQQSQRGFSVDVEVTLEETRTGRTFTARGEGHASRAATSAFFSVRDDRVLFDATGVGNATMKALNDAAAQVLEQYQSTLK